MNMQALMAQAKKIQGDLEKSTKEIENKDFIFENNIIKIEAKGNNSITKITIIDKSVLEDSEMLEDILVVGLNNLLNQIKKEKESKLGKYTGGLGGLF